MPRCALRGKRRPAAPRRGIGRCPTGPTPLHTHAGGGGRDEGRRVGCKVGGDLVQVGEDAEPLLDGMEGAAGASELHGLLDLVCEWRIEKREDLSDGGHLVVHLVVE
jgi:hypothetical protein